MAKTEGGQVQVLVICVPELLALNLIFCFKGFSFIPFYKHIVIKSSRQALVYSPLKVVFNLTGICVSNLGGSRIIPSFY